MSAAYNNKYFLGVRRRGSADLSLRGCFGLGSHVRLSVSWQITWTLAGCADLSWDASSRLHVVAHPLVGWPDLAVSQQRKRERECGTALPPRSVGKASHKARPDSRCGAGRGWGGGGRGLDSASQWEELQSHIARGMDTGKGTTGTIPAMNLHKTGCSGGDGVPPTPPNSCASGTSECDLIWNKGLCRSN